MDGTAVGRRISRRQFFGGAAAAAVPVYLRGGGTGRFLAASAAPAAGRTLTLAAFTRVLGTRFRVRTASFRFADLTLVEVNGHPRPTAGQAVSGESYSLIFRGGGDEAVHGGTYRVGHPAFGWFPMSLAPVGMALHGQRYEAVVNRRAPDSR